MNWFALVDCQSPHSLKLLKFNEASLNDENILFNKKRCFYRFYSISFCVNGIGEDDFMDLIIESPASMLDKIMLWNEYSKLTNPQAMFQIHNETYL